MNGLLNSFRSTALAHWYGDLNQRDQRITLAVGALVVLVMLYFLLWSPIANWREASQAEYEDAQSLLSFISNNQERARASATQGGAGQSLLAVVGGVARSHQLTLSRFQPEANGGVSVVMQNAEFNSVIAFLSELEDQHGLQVRQMSLDRQDPGRVSARLVVF